MLPFREDGNPVSMKDRPSLLKDAAKLNNERTKEAIRRFNPQVNISYGSHPKMKYDLYSAGENTPVMVVFSGGAFLRAKKQTFSLWANLLVPNGISLIDVGYPQIDDTPLLKMINNAIYLINHVRTEISDKVILAGQSSGASVIASAAIKLANKDSLENIIGIYLASGYYDMRPMQLSARGNYMKLTPEQATMCSAICTVYKPLPPTMITVGQLETGQSLTQNGDFYRELLRYNTPVIREVIFMKNHFAIADELYYDNTKSWKFIQSLLHK
jgi:acetyl esterase/lipase|tara:strand:+ start:5259 stop:6071 length:813 start_codon:yes stop_codon:yes gene_type:complete